MFYTLFEHLVLLVKLLRILEASGKVISYRLIFLFFV